jgi:beta-ureidopropionase / N-carbamoyl-L-amino-acid hydrolase
VLADLRELQRRTGDNNGAQRVCWTEPWRGARAYLTELLAEIGLAPEIDEAGNLWSYLEGEREPALALGSHIDSVPDGGWLDGAYGVMAAVGVLRAWAQSGTRPPRTLAIVDFADEEGARFGRSLYGSSAVTGSLDAADLARAVDAEGRTAEDVLAENGVNLERAANSRSRLERIGAYLELHIEQGPVLEAEGAGLAAVTGCVGIERLRFEFTGQTGHAGTTPMPMRRDAGLAAATTALAVERIAVEEGGVGTAGRLDMSPGIVTAVPGGAGLAVDLRHSAAGSLARMLERAREAAGAAADGRNCELREEPVWRIDPVAFDAELVKAAAGVAGGRRLASGALHDAAAIARVRPAAMLFVPSIAGISHAREEDTAEADLRAGVIAFGEFAARVAAR